MDQVGRSAARRASISSLESQSPGARVASSTRRRSSEVKGTTGAARRAASTGSAAGGAGVDMGRVYTAAEARVLEVATKVHRRLAALAKSRRLDEDLFRLCAVGAYGLLHALEEAGFRRVVFVEGQAYRRDNGLVRGSHCWVWVEGVFQILCITARQFRFESGVLAVRRFSDEVRNRDGDEIGFCPVSWGPFDARFAGWNRGQPEYAPATYAPLRWWAGAAKEEERDMILCKVSSKNSAMCGTHRRELGPDGLCEAWLAHHGVERAEGPMLPPARRERFRLRAVDAFRLRRMIAQDPASWDPLLRQTLVPYLDHPDALPGPTARGATGSRWVEGWIPFELWERFNDLAGGDTELLERHLVAAFERAWRTPGRAKRDEAPAPSSSRAPGRT